MELPENEAQKIAEAVVGPIEWDDAYSGYCECPGKHHHTNGDGKRDCQVHLDSGGQYPPTVTCFHDSCTGEVEAINYSLRSALGKAEAALRRGTVVEFPPRVESFQPKGKEKKAPVLKGMTAQQVMRGAKAEVRPEGLEDPTRTLLRAAFEPGEWINVTLAGKIGEDIRPRDAGRCRSWEEWMELLAQAEGTWGKVPGAHDLGAYICLNPLKDRASARKNANVAAWRHVLVEFDDIPQDEQWALLRRSKLPITAVIDSGGKSVHAWVRVDATNKDNYDRAVRSVYAFFDGYEVDGKNKNPSRLSRLAGAQRGERMQSLLAVNIGLASFEAWERWRRQEPEVMAWDSIQAASWERPDVLVDNILHRGSKMTLGGGSKSFKSWSLLDLAYAVATGTPWWGNPTKKGRVLVVDFELTPFFWRERMRAIVVAKGGEPPVQIDLLPMRGRMADFDQVRKYVREACDAADYDLIILDPIYKCLGGRDENLAGDVAELMNEIESLTLETGAAVVIAAHYSKGNQAAKDSLDRISGSGVFARDPDAILSMTKHDQDGSFTVDVTLRNFEPIKPFVVTWTFPLMVRNRELNPDDIKLPPNERARQPKITAAAMLRELRGLAPMTKQELMTRVMEQFGIAKSKFYEVFKEAEQSGKLTMTCGLYTVREES
jgi:RecA-family ATPase